jgi:hypothetical protein
VPVAEEGSVMGVNVDIDPTAAAKGSAEKRSKMNVKISREGRAREDAEDAEDDFKVGCIPNGGGSIGFHNFSSRL